MKCKLYNISRDFQTTELIHFFATIIFSQSISTDFFGYRLQIEREEYPFFFKLQKLKNVGKQKRNGGQWTDWTNPFTASYVVQVILY